MKRTSSYGRSSQRSWSGGARRPSYKNFSGGRGGRGGSRQSFDPSMFVKKAVDVLPEAAYVPQNAFADFDLHEQLHRNIATRGYTLPTPIQDQTIPHLLEGRDVVGLANTGTGKTAAFLIPLIQKAAMDTSERVLIVAPTRELAVQIEQEFRQLSQRLRLNSALCIGGVNIRGQFYALQRSPQFVIGTPGRLRDLEEQRALDFSTFTTIVLDEVDRMFDMGFIRDVRHMISLLPKDRHSLFFSATLTDNLHEIMREFLNNPIKISVKSREAAANIDQDIVRMDGKMKIDVLHDLLNRAEFDKVLIFSRTKRGTEKLAQMLHDRGFSVGAIHGNKSQSQRQRAIDLFKKNRMKVLVATDVASRGIDIDNVSHVINFDLPESYEDYIHRIGRTGRANKKGVALTFIE